MTDDKRQTEEPATAQQTSSAKDSDTSPEASKAAATEKTASATAQDSGQKPVQSRSPDSARAEGKSSSLRSGVIFLIVVMALGAAGYWAWLQLEQRALAVSEQDTRHQEQLATLASATEQAAQQTRQANVALQQRVDELEVQLRAAQLAINSQGARIIELGGASRSDWLLAEAEYLARLASQRLYTERNTANPEALLLEADAILRELNDAELLPARRALADDITALRLAGRVDREGIYLELQSLTAALTQLPLLQVQLQEQDVVSLAEPVDSEGPETGWRDKLAAMAARSGEALSSLVNFRYRQQPVEPLLSQADETVVRHNLRILLEQAQLSLLREEQAIYSTSLMRASEWLDNYFELNPQAAVLAERLAMLRETSIVQALPDISGSLRALGDLIDLRHKRVADPETES